MGLYTLIDAYYFIMMKLNNNKKNRIEVWDIIFIFWFVTNAVYNHTMIGIIGQTLFIIYSITMMIVGRSKLKWPSILVYYLIFCLIVYINIDNGFSIVPKDSIFMLNVLLRNAIFFFCLYQYIINKNISKIRDIVVFSCFAASILMLILQYQITGSFSMRVESEDGFNGNIQAVTNSIIACWVIIEKCYSVPKRYIVIVILLLFSILAGTRKALIVFIACLSLYYLLSDTSKIILNIVRVLLLLIFALYIVMEVPFVYEIIGHRIESMFSFVNGGETDASTDSRIYYIELGLYHFSNRPWIGYGINCFKSSPGAYGVYSHCNYVELLFSVGILGFIAFYAMHAKIAYTAIKTYFCSHNIYSTLAISFLVGVFLYDYGMVSYLERINILMLILLMKLATIKTYESLK